MTKLTRKRRKEDLAHRVTVRETRRRKRRRIRRNPSHPRKTKRRKIRRGRLVGVAVVVKVQMTSVIQTGRKSRLLKKRENN